MRSDRVEGKWIDLFAEVFALCKVGRDEPCAILSETQSRPLNVQLTELALHRLGAKPFHAVVPTPRQSAPVPIRSTGASTALQSLAPTVAAVKLKIEADHVNGTEQRAFAGNFLYSTGANEVARRYTLGHFDLPLRRCTLSIDGKVVVRDGALAE